MQGQTQQIDESSRVDRESEWPAGANCWRLFGRKMSVALECISNYLECLRVYHSGEIEQMKKSYSEQTVQSANPSQRSTIQSAQSDGKCLLKEYPVESYLQFGAKGAEVEYRYSEDFSLSFNESKSLLKNKLKINEISSQQSGWLDEFKRWLQCRGGRIAQHSLMPLEQSKDEPSDQLIIQRSFDQRPARVTASNQLIVPAIRRQLNIFNMSDSQIDQESKRSYFIESEQFSQGDTINFQKALILESQRETIQPIQPAMSQTQRIARRAKTQSNRLFISFKQDDKDDDDLVDENALPDSTVFKDLLHKTHIKWISDGSMQSKRIQEEKQKEETSHKAQQQYIDQAKEQTSRMARQQYKDQGKEQVSSKVQTGRRVRGLGALRQVAQQQNEKAPQIEKINLESLQLKLATLRHEERRQGNEQSGLLIFHSSRAMPTKESIQQKPLTQRQRREERVRKRRHTKSVDYQGSEVMTVQMI